MAAKMERWRCLTPGCKVKLMTDTAVTHKAETAHKVAAWPVKKRRARGDGGLTQRQNGLYIGKVERPRDPVTGERRWATVSSMDYKEAVQKLNAAKADLAKYGDLAVGTETVSSWMNHWINNINRSRPSTRKGYRTLIKSVDASIGNIKLSHLTPIDVRKLETYMVKTRGMSSTTALQAYQMLAKSLKDAEREGRVTRNVARLVDPPRRAVSNANVLSVEEGIKVIGSVTEERLGSRYAAALLTGARQGELIGLEIDRVDFINNTIELSWQLQRVDWQHGERCEVIGVWEETGRPKHECERKRGVDCPNRRIDAPSDWEHRHIIGALYWSRPKSKAGWRIIPLVEPLRSILARRIAAAANEPNPYGLVWTTDPKKSKGGLHTVRKTLPLDGSPLDPSRDNKAWHAVLERAGVPDVRLHDARHTAVTIMYELDVPETIIQDIVGQSTISTTRGYRHKSTKQLVAAMEALGGRLTGRSQAGLEKLTAVADEEFERRFELELERRGISA